MKNQELSKILRNMAIYLEMKSVPFKPQAYEKAAYSIESLDNDIQAIYEKNGLKGLEEIPGVGKGIAERIEEYLKTGAIKNYEKFKKEIPVDLETFYGIEGLGPKRIAILYKILKIK
ncbi:MAG: DNA polymerase III, partial [Ignavibacteriales bacterium]